MMARRYEAYKAVVVKPFFRDHFGPARPPDRAGRRVERAQCRPAAVADLSAALTGIRGSYRPAPLLARQRLHQPAHRPHLIGATPRPTTCTMPIRPASSASPPRPASPLCGRRSSAPKAGARVEIAALASVRATREGVVSNGGERLRRSLARRSPARSSERRDLRRQDGNRLLSRRLAGDPGAQRSKSLGQDRGRGAALRPLPAPPLGARARTAEGMKLSLPHVGLDRALEFLIGDRLA